MLADAIEQALPELRAEAEAQMKSSCTIRAKSTGRSTNPTTGAVTPTPGETLYAGKCRVRPGARLGSGTAEIGGAEAFTFDYLVAIPFGQAGVVEGARVTIDTSPDPSLVGVAVDVEKVDRGEDLTARRLFCSEVA